MHVTKLWLLSWQPTLTGKPVRKKIPRDLNWLWKPINFKHPQSDYLRGINYSFVKKGTKILMNFLGERIKVDFNADYLSVIFDKAVKLGTAKFVCLTGH